MAAEHWESESFDVLTVSPVTDLLAVYAIEDPNNPGFYTLETSPVHFVGTALVTTKYWSRSPKQGPAMIGSDTHKRVVGIDLSEGYFTVCDEASNFAGLTRAGEDIRKAIGMLNMTKYPLSPAFLQE